MTLADFDALVVKTPYVQNGMFFSEVYLFLRCCAKAGVTRIIESGVKRGNSTRVLAQAAGVPILSIDRKNFLLKPPAGVEFRKGDARELLPRLLPRFAGERLGILLDGPKNDKGRALKDVCLRFPQVRVVACHDTPPGFGETLHSHDPALRAAHAGLDRFIPEPTYSAKPNGPGLGVWMAAV